MVKHIKTAIACIDRLSLWAIVIAAASLVIIMLIEVLNALGRKFAIPFPCTLEAAESLMICCIFLAAPRVASLDDHTYVTLVTRKLPDYITRSMDAFANLLGGVITTILVFGAWEIAITSIVRMEMRIGVFRFPIWPFRLIFAMGLSLLAIQLVANGIRCIVQIYEGDYPDGDGLKI